VRHVWPWALLWLILLLLLLLMMLLFLFLLLLLVPILWETVVLVRAHRARARPMEALLRLRMGRGIEVWLVVETINLRHLARQVPCNHERIGCRHWSGRVRRRMRITARCRIVE